VDSGADGILIANSTITLESVAAVEVLEDISFFDTMGRKLVERLGAKIRKIKTFRVRDD
jgi:hypothetical protein